jgi:flagellar hook-associated protein 3 FlgL
MRVTSNSDFMSAMADIERAATDLAKWQAQVSSQRRLQVPSDDPAAMARSVAERAEMGTIDQYVRAADSVSTRLTAVDAVLADMVTRLTTARAAAGAARGSVPTDAQREAIATQLEAIADALVSDINTSFRGAYMFAGSEALTAPYAREADGTVSAYQGDGTGVAVDIDRSRAVQVGFDGRVLAQGSDAEDVFACLTHLVAAIRGNDQAGIGAGLEGLERAFDRAVALQGAVGMDLANLDDERARLATLRRASVARVSHDEDVNLPEAISRMSRADAAYQAALAAIGTRSRLSLLDYLR